MSDTFPFEAKDFQKKLLNISCDVDVSFNKRKENIKNYIFIDPP